MAHETTLDARDVDPHQLLDRVLTAVRGFDRDDRLRVLTEYEPVALYPVFERNNFGHTLEVGEGSVFVLTLWLKG